MDGRFVVTGSGRCGTAWMSRALTAAGVPCGHEAVFNADHDPVWPDGLRADSSWMAATDLKQVDVPVAMMVRHPLAVVRSWVEIGFFDWDLDNPTHGPLMSAFPRVYGWRTPQDKALDMWLSLTMAALGRAETVVRLEHLNAATFRRFLGWAGADPTQADRVLKEVLTCNRHEDSRQRTGVDHDPTWADHDGFLAVRAIELADMLGYGEGPNDV